jgi:hypothetical protein
MIADVNNKERWLLARYELFGEIGLVVLNVEKISNIVGLNGSSYYLYSEGMEIFEAHLFPLHIVNYESFFQLITDYDKIDVLLVRMSWSVKLDWHFSDNYW